MAISTHTDPAVTVRGRGTLSGRRAHSKLSVGGVDRSGTGRPVGGRPVPTRDIARPARRPGTALVPDAFGAGRGR